MQESFLMVYIAADLEAAKNKTGERRPHSVKTAAV